MEPTTKTTNGVAVSIEIFYQQDYSNPIHQEFMFAYRVKLTNYNPFAVKLIGRKWEIFDSHGSYREVEGEGVVGMQPVIDNLKEYEYVSGSNFHTEIGRMNGIYFFENQVNKKKFEVLIPVFWLVAPFKMN